MVLLVVRLVVLLVGRLVVVGFVADGDPLSAAPLGAGEVQCKLMMAMNMVMMMMMTGRRERMITTEAGIGGGARRRLWAGGTTSTCVIFLSTYTTLPFLKG